MYTGSIEMMILIVVAVFILLHTPHPVNLNVFTPKYSPTGWGGVALGLVFAFTSLSGCGSMAFLGTEAKNAHLNMRKGVVVVILILTSLFLFMSYVMTVGWGVQNMGTYFTNFIPGMVLALRDCGIILAVIFFIFMVNSGMVDTLAIINAGARDMYTMAKDGLLIKKFSLTHPVHKSPHMALILQTIVGIVIFTVTGWLFGPLNGFLVTGLWTGVGTMIDHILLNTSLPLYFRKVKSLRWTYVVVPAVASAIYLFAIYGSFLSINIYIIIGTIVLVIWLLVGGIIYSYKKGIRIALEEGEEI